MTDQKLPEARLVPRNAEDRIAIRGRANEGARKAARVTVKVCRAVTVLAICGAGLAVLRAGVDTRPRSRALDDLDRQIESFRRFNAETQFDKLEYDRLRIDIERLLDPRLHDFRAHQLQLADQIELTPEGIHAR